MGCKEGRSTDKWCDFNFYGHQVVAHKVSDSYRGDANPMGNPVDGHGVPVPHFGLVLAWNDFDKLVNKIKKSNIKFIIAPYTRFAGLPGEQRTMFFKDPSTQKVTVTVTDDDGTAFSGTVTNVTFEVVLILHLFIKSISKILF